MNPEQARLYNILFLCLVVERYQERFRENGAIILNYLVRERSGIEPAEAFALIADALSDGALTIDRDNGKRLVVERQRFIQLRDKFHEHLPQIQSQVVSEKWTFSTPLRKDLTDSERMSLDKNIKLGRIPEMNQEGVVKTVGPDRGLAGCFESVVRKSCSAQNVSDPPDDLREALMKTMSGPIGDLARMCPDSDFVFLVEKNGNKIVPKFKIIKREGRSVNIDWSET